MTLFSTVLESNLSTEEGSSWLGFLVDDAPSEEVLERIEQIKRIMKLLPDLEADYIDLYYFKKYRQTEIARLFRVSQPTVCYRLKRAIQRIMFIMSLPKISEEEISRILSRHIDDYDNVRIMVLMFSTTCQSEVAKILKMSQGKVRYRFLQTVQRISKIEELSDLYEIFYNINLNLTIRQDVRNRPSAKQYIVM